MLGKCGQHVHHELVGMRIVGRDEIDAAFHKTGDEMDVSSEAIELGNDQGCPGPLGAPPMRALIADKGYDGDDFRADIVNRGAKPVIPNKSNRTALHRFNKRAYK